MQGVYSRVIEYGSTQQENRIRKFPDAREFSPFNSKQIVKIIYLKTFQPL
jgi:hypothetical protein